MTRLPKKGMAMQTIIGIALLTFVFFIMLGVWNVAWGKAKGSVSEEACHTSNALRVKTAISPESLIGLEGKGQIRLPTACKRQDIGVIPDDAHIAAAGDKQKAALAQVAELTSKCWWMFLEGRDFGKKTVLDPKILPSKDLCFICYIFSVQEGVEFNMAQLQQFMNNEFYTVLDSSDRCTATNGGICKKDCSSDENDPGKQFTIPVTSMTCADKQAGTQCCVNDERYDCINKGGRCSYGGEYTKSYDGWRCREGSCYVKESNYFSYLDYIQRFGGLGRFYVRYYDQFKPHVPYAVVFTEYNNKDFLGIFDTHQEDSLLVTDLARVQELCAVQEGVTA